MSHQRCTHCHRSPREVLQWQAVVPSCDRLKSTGTHRSDYYDKFLGQSGNKVLLSHIHNLRRKTESFTKLFCNNSFHKSGTEIKEPDASAVKMHCDNY